MTPASSLAILDPGRSCLRYFDRKETPALTAPDALWLAPAEILFPARCACLAEPDGVDRISYHQGPPRAGRLDRSLGSGQIGCDTLGPAR